jgi:hypothetical protein
MFGDTYPSRNKSINTLPDMVKSGQGVFSNKRYAIKSEPLKLLPPQSF